MMGKQKLIVLFGTRPEAIKLAPVILELQNHPQFNPFVISTGQHREMLLPILDIFNLQPDLDLKIMQEGQSLSQSVATILTKLEQNCRTQEFSGILVQGDTASAMAASLWGFLNKIPVFHVEAGLRTNNLMSPWPEEFNRRIISVASQLHFTPTEQSKQNLLNEGIEDKKIFNVGNTVIDALLSTSEKIEQAKDTSGFLNSFPFKLDEQKKMILTTVHRRESFGSGLEQIFLALSELAENPDWQVILPLHMNPVVRETAARILSRSRVIQIEPLSYLPFVFLMKNADLILTDSGGVQEEAPTFRKPILVLRETTERPEGVEAGFAKLVGTNRQLIVQESKEILKNNGAQTKLQQINNPYGDGNSAKYIVKIISEHLRG